MTIKGSCHSCGKPVAYLRVVEGQVVLVVACEDCAEEVHFNLQTMVNALSSNEPNYDQMLEDFVPKGLPN